MRIEELRQQFARLGAKPCHEARLLRAWTQARALDSGTRRQAAQDFLPQALRDALPALAGSLDANACFLVQDGEDKIIAQTCAENYVNLLRATWPNLLLRY